MKTTFAGLHYIKIIKKMLISVVIQNPDTSYSHETMLTQKEPKIQSPKFSSATRNLCVTILYTSTIVADNLKFPVFVYSPYNKIYPATGHALCEQNKK